MSTLSFMGDVWLPKPLKCEVEIDGDFILNLESPITRAKESCPGKICLKAPGNYIAQTFGRKPVAVCLANNHIMDYGEEGFADTLEELRKAGISYYGAGTLDENCNNPLILRIGGARIALLGYVCPTTHPVFATAGSPGVAPIIPERIAEDIRQARLDNAERIFISFHWGMEQARLPKWTDIVIARQVIDFGADLVVGHHAHCIQPELAYKGKTISFGLGNFIFPELPRSVYALAYAKNPKWMKESCISVVDVSSLETTYYGTLFQEGRVTRSANVARSLRMPSVSNKADYERRFQAHLRYCFFRNYLHALISNKRLPKASSVSATLKTLLHNSGLLA